MKKNGYTIFLLILLINTLIIGIVGNYVMITKSIERTETGFRSSLNEERLSVNAELNEVSQMADLIAEQIIQSIDNPMNLSDSEYESNYTEGISELIKSALNCSDNIITGYIRYNPELAGPKAGVFWQNKNGHLKKLETTDMSKYDSNDLEHVGWYYIPISYGDAMWIDPYSNNNIDVEMISYVVPLFKDGVEIGIVGFDLDIDYLVSLINNIDLCDGGYALITDRTGRIINEDNIKPINDEEYSQTVKLSNDMELTYVAPYKVVFAMRYSFFFRSYMCLFILIFLTLFISQFIVLIIRSRRNRLKYEGTWYLGLLKWVFFIFTLAVFMVQVLYFINLYKSQLEVRFDKVNTPGTYETTIQVVGVSDFAPYSFVNSEGNPDGFDVELIKEIANRNHVNVEINLMSYEEAMKNLRRHSTDLMIGLRNVSMDNSVEITASDITSYDDYEVYGKHSISNIQVLADSKIGIIEGDAPMDIFGLENHSDRYSNAIELMTALELGDIDYAMVRGGSAVYAIRELGYSDIQSCYDIMDTNICVGVASGNTELVSMINQTLVQMKSDGTYDLLYERWLEEYKDMTLLSLISEEKYFVMLSMLLFVVFFVAFIFVRVFAIKDKQIRQKQSLMNELQLQSDIDELTGLYNRHAYEVRLRELRLNDNIKNLTVVALDVNGLKETNDNRGHAIGDELLRGAAQCVRDAFSSMGSCYRIGGDEFVAILDKDIPSSDQLSVKFNSVLREWTSEEIEKLSISFGIVDSNEYPMITIDEMIEAADQLMYADKIAYYQQAGIDRRGQQSAYGVLKDSYTKILKVNLTLDLYSIIQVDAGEMTKKRGYAEKISTWLHDFATSGQVHPEDRDYYLENVEINHLRDFFRSQKSQFCIQYRRKIGDSFSNVMLEMMRAPEYTDDNQVVFLFVKNTAPEESYKGRILSSTDLKNELKRREEVEKLIRLGLENDYFYMMYQPQYKTEGKLLRGFESLIRLTMPDGTRMSPAEFIPDAESSDLIMDIDNYVLERVMTEFRGVVAGTDLIVSVNLSAKSIASPNFSDKISAMLKGIGYPANNLELEITEYSLTNDEDTVFDNITKLRQMGVKIALDDFGTGYTSLSQMVRIPFDLLKMDKSLVDDIESNDMKRDFSNAVIELGHMVNSEVIAEGVEKNEQLDILLNQGCDFIQGYIWGRPLLVKDAIALTK